MATILVIAAVVGLVLVLNALFPGALDRESARMDLVYGVALVAFFSSAILFMFRQNWSRTLRHAAIWCLLAALLVLLYSYRHDFENAAMRIAGELVPGMAIERVPGEVFVRSGEGGHYRVRAEVNGQPVSFLIDTGASTVVLSHADAERAGIDTRELAFTLRASTANGVAYVAPFGIGEIRIGSIRIDNITGAVAQDGDLDESLLGMSFLSRLDAVEFDRNGLVLRQ